MRGKKGIELSMNFIVILIISIVLFGFGLRFIYKLVNTTQDFGDMTFDQFDQAVGDLICQNADKVCITGDQKEVKRDQIAIFGIRIMNILDSQKFDVVVTRPSPAGYTKDGTGIFGDRIEWKPRIRNIYIPANEEVRVGIGVHVPKVASSGSYIFNVDIKAQDGSSYGNTQKLYVNIP